VGATAFVNITRDHLLGERYKIFDPAAVVLELLETVDGDAAVVDACARAVAEGYRLALDDYDGRASHDPLTTRDSREWWVVSSSFGSGVTRDPLLPYSLLRRDCATRFAMLACIESALYCAASPAARGRRALSERRAQRRA